MKIRSIGIVVIIVALLAFALPSSAQPAPPPLPSSFYGTVRLNGASVPDGTLITASINGVVYASYRTTTYQGWGSVFALDVAGDQAGTQAIEGGKVGDKITFKIGAWQADQTAMWQSGTNTRLDLTATQVYKTAPVCRVFTFMRGCK